MRTALTFSGGKLSFLQRLPLASQFAIVGGAIMLLAMALAGYAMSSIASNATVEHAAGATALFLDSLLEPLTQELARDPVLTAENARRLDQLLDGEPFKERFPFLDIWKEGGLISYSTTPSLVGKRFEQLPGLLSALQGQIAAEFTYETIREPVIKYLEIWVPIRDQSTGRVIAVAEIHEKTETLERQLAYVRVQTWLLVAGSTLMVMLSLFGVVYRGSRVIEAQRRELGEQVAHIQSVSDQNVALRQKAQRASGGVAEMTEAYLRRIGAEIHDGPAQLVGYASLKVEHARLARTANARNLELNAIDAALAEAMQDIRQISKSLMLPEIEDLSLPEVVDRVVRMHERRTGMTVDVRTGTLPNTVPPAVKICTYRFFQEGLNNALHHAGGAAVFVACEMEGPELRLTVRDEGGPSAVTSGSGLGLVGLRERAESLGGSFAITRDETGFRIEIRLPVSIELQHA
jgi:signal transduction histidine kinase